MNDELRYLKRVSTVDGHSGTILLGLEKALTASSRPLPTIRALYWKYAPDYYRRRWSQRGIAAYDVSIDPAKTVWVPPDEITHFTNRGRSPHKWRELDIGRVLSGDWDRGGRAFDDHIIHRSLSQRFLDGSSWRETPIVRRALESLREDGTAGWSCQSNEDILEKCRRMDRLYDEIRENGFKSQYQLWKSGALPNPSFRDLVANNIMVDISRDGELLLVDSKHRLSMAKLLGLDLIPVSVLVRHRGWMESLQSIGETERGDTYSDIRHLK